MRTSTTLAGSPAAAAGAYGKLQIALGITVGTLRAFGVRPSHTPAQALALIKGIVGSRVWARAEVAGSMPAVSAVLLGALPRVEPSPPTPRPRDCSHAGNREGSRFCMHCGAALRNDCYTEPETALAPARPLAANGSRAARVATARSNPSVLKIFREQTGNHSLEQIAEQWVTAEDAVYGVSQ